MTHSQISCFLLVAKHLSFSKTASELSITQPAVSRLISQLELELGFQLFERVQKGVRLTAAGKIMEDFFQRYRRELDRAVEEARLAGRGYDRVIRIGCRDVWDIANFYPPLEAHFAGIFPRLKLVIEGYDATALLRALKQGEVDVVISTMSHLLDDPEITSQKLVTVGSHLLFSRSHPLADQSQLEIQTFRELPFFTINEPEGPHNAAAQIRSYCRSKGFEPKIVNLPSLTAELIKVQSGEGVVLADDWMIVTSSNLFQGIRTELAYEIGVGWLEDRQTSLRALFVRELLNFYRHQTAQSGETPAR